MKTDFKEISWEGVNWIHRAQDKDKWRALLNVVRNFRVQYNAGNFLVICKIISFSKGTLLRGVSLLFTCNLFCMFASITTFPLPRGAPKRGGESGLPGCSPPKSPKTEILKIQVL
jgi:hypothetical protein